MEMATVQAVIQSYAIDPNKVYTSAEFGRIVTRRYRRQRGTGPALTQLVEAGAIQRIRHGHYVVPVRRRA
jgi:hypothetical protein